MASIGTSQSAQPQPVSLTAGIEEAKENIKAFKTFIEVSRAQKELTKSAANSATQAKSQITSQLDKVKDLQKRYLRNPPTSMDNLLGLIGETQGSGQDTSRYIRKTILEAAAGIEPKLSAIVKEETIKALGCSVEQSYTGVSAKDLELQPLPLRPQQEGIYIPISSIDLFSNLKTDPESVFGKIFYEKQNPSSSNEFRPYGGNVAYPMNKQLYQLTESKNNGRSFSQINGKNYLGKSGQNLFDIQYTKTNNFGVTGDYYRVMLINREDSTGDVLNNVGQYITDYYSTIKLVDNVDIAANIINQLNGAVSFKAQVGAGQLSEKSRFDLIVARILGLCFDSKREIDVSGISKIAELDGVDDSFFELTEIDLRNIEVSISNIQNGVMEFEDCDNVKLPIDADVLISELVNFRETAEEQTTAEQVETLESIIDSVSQNPNWPLLIPNNFNANVAINTSIIKKIPLAVASSVLGPKVLLPLYTLLSVIQSGETYTYNQAVTAINSGINEVNSVINEGNAGSDIGRAASNIVTNGTEFLKKFKTFSIEVISRINREFLQVLFDILKRDIVNLTFAIVQDINRARIGKYTSIVLRLVTIILGLGTIFLTDVTKCKSLINRVLTLLRLVNDNTSLRPNFKIPLPLLALAGELPGISPINMTINAISALQKLGIPTGTLPDGSPNFMLQFSLASFGAIVKNIAEDGKIEGVGASGPVTGKFI